MTLDSRMRDKIALNAEVVRLREELAALRSQLATILATEQSKSDTPN